jgi:plastocyanin
MKRTIATIGLIACGLVLIAAIQPDDSHRIAQVVALDECDPATFNAPAPTGLGPDFCKNINLGFSTTLPTLVAESATPNPDPKWDFEPDTLNVEEGTVLSVVDQGGEPHTFTEVKQFGGGFIGALNNSQPAVPECAAGFDGTPAGIAVAKTRILQGSTSLVTGLSKGTHYFQCCIHPWMHFTVQVQ